MQRPRVLAIIQAGGKGSRMDVLTRETPKPVLPFAGSYRLIDFPLSNLRNSGVSDVWLSVQYLAQDLGDAVANGKPWDLDRHHGGFKLVVPEEISGSGVDEGFVSGNAEELLKNRDMIRRHDPDVVLVMSADHVYRLDYMSVVEAHLARGAECTIVTTEVAVEDASNHATVGSNSENRVTEFVYKPTDPATGVVATEVFAYAPGPLLEVLEELHRELAGRAEPDEEGLSDFGVHLLPRLVERGKVFSYALDGYWRDLGRPESYFAAHRELLFDDLDLFADPQWPITTNGVPLAPTRIRAGATVRDSLVSPGCDIRGTVINSVLGPGVTVAEGAVVSDAVVMADVVIAAGARVTWAIIDTGCVIGADARVGATAEQTDEAPNAGEAPDEDGDVTQAELVLLGRDCEVKAGTVVPANDRWEPGTTL